MEWKYFVDVGKMHINFKCDIGFIDFKQLYYSTLNVNFTSILFLVFVLELYCVCYQNIFNNKCMPINQINVYNTCMNYFILAKQAFFEVFSYM